MSFFSELTDVIFPAIGAFFSVIADVARMPFSSFVQLFTGLSGVTRTITNFMTGETLTYSLSPIGALTSELLAQAGFLGFLVDFILVYPIRLTEWLLGLLFSSIANTIPFVGDSSTWVVLLMFVAIISIPLVIFKRIRSIFW